MTSGREHGIIRRENKAEHHRSHRLAAVETVNISVLAGGESRILQRNGGAGSDDAYFLKSTHLFLFENNMFGGAGYQQTRAADQ